MGEGPSQADLADAPPAGGRDGDLLSKLRHTASTGTMIFLVTPGTRAPQVFEARDPASDRPVTVDDLLDVVRRLLIDFHGLGQDWDNRPDADDYRRVLRALPPAVPAQRRTRPIREATLAKPIFQYELTYWERLSDALLPPKLKAAVADCDLLCIVPHGPLHALPFAALRWSAGEYLLERFGLASAPSATVLRFCQYKNLRRAAKGGAAHRPESCFVAAVAAADNSDPSAFESDGEMLADLFRRHGVSGRVTSLVGARATANMLPASKELIARLAGGHDVVHLACHGVFGTDLGSDDPLDSGLLVSDGTAAAALLTLRKLAPEEREPFLFTARDAFALDLRADLVTLRACSSGRADRTFRHGLSPGVADDGPAWRLKVDLASASLGTSPVGQPQDGPTIRAFERPGQEQAQGCRLKKRQQRTAPR
jgi:hypothetical protein